MSPMISSPVGRKMLERLDGLHDVEGRHVASLHLLAVHVDLDGPDLAAEDDRRDRAGDRHDPAAHLVTADVVERLFVKALPVQCHQAGRRRGRRVERHDHRRQGPRRQVRNHRLRPR